MPRAVNASKMRWKRLFWGARCAALHDRLAKEPRPGCVSYHSSRLTGIVSAPYSPRCRMGLRPDHRDGWFMDWAGTREAPHAIKKTRTFCDEQAVDLGHKNRCPRAGT